MLSFAVHTFSSTGFGPVAQAVECWTPYGGSARAAYKVRGLRRDGRSTVYWGPFRYGGPGEVSEEAGCARL